LKRRQPNKRKRLTRDDNDSMVSQCPQGRNSNTINDLDRLMHLWTGNNDYKDSNGQSMKHELHSPSGSSSGSSSPVSNRMIINTQEQTEPSQKIHPLNLSIANHVMSSE